MRVFLAALVHETNSFSPLPTTVRSFEDALLHRPGDSATLEQANHSEAYGEAFAALTEMGDEVVPGICAWAQPAGPLSRRAYEKLREELLDGLRAAGPVDAVLLVLHGAMLADDYDDCEGDILRRAREIVGASAPIGALLDLHGNVGPGMLDSGAILVGCKEYPHSDYMPRARELRALLAKVAANETSVETHLHKLPMVVLSGTTESPMRDFVRRLESVEGANGILSVSAMHGFAWSDTPEMGASILVVHEAQSAWAATNARELARSLAKELFGMRTEIVAKLLPLDAALDAALAARSDRGPVVFADSSDNPGGGSACDSTFVLRALLSRNASNVALGMIWDPQAAIIAADVGVGARIPLRIGGKVGPLSGDPLDVIAEVRAVEASPYQRDAGGQGAQAMGLSVALKVDGIEIVINSIRQQTFSTNVFTDLGIDLKSKVLVVVKSSQHFRTSFDEVSSSTIYCNAPGTLNLDLKDVPYKRIRRPIWPLDSVHLES